MPAASATGTANDAASCGERNAFAAQNLPKQRKLAGNRDPHDPVGILPLLDELDDRKMDTTKITSDALACASL